MEKNFLELGILSATVKSGYSTSRLPLHQHSRVTGWRGGLKRNYRQTDRWLKKLEATEHTPTLCPGTTTISNTVWAVTSLVDTME